MRLTIISDTHGEHEKLGVLQGDVLIHCGDMFNMFKQDPEEFDAIDDWFGRQRFDLVLCVGGNHDFELQKRAAYVDEPFRNAVYLEGRSIEHAGHKFFGAPWVPDLRGQAFFLEGQALADKWAAIPSETDVLITHTPPADVLDVSSAGFELGCEHLANAMTQLSPRLHCFGHVHASSGTSERGGTTYINAAVVNSQYQLAREPYYFYL